MVFGPVAQAAVTLGNRGASQVIRTRNHKFRKIARALPLLEEKSK